jgi:hypothetical protein
MARNKEIDDFQLVMGKTPHFLSRITEYFPLEFTAFREYNISPRGNGPFRLEEMQT